MTFIQGFCDNLQKLKQKTTSRHPFSSFAEDLSPLHTALPRLHRSPRALDQGRGPGRGRAGSGPGPAAHLGSVHRRARRRVLRSQGSRAQEARTHLFHSLLCSASVQPARGPLSAVTPPELPELPEHSAGPGRSGPVCAALGLTLNGSLLTRVIWQPRPGRGHVSRIPPRWGGRIRRG